MEKIKAATVTKYGPPEVIEVGEILKPEPKKNDILVKVHSTTVTTGDVWIRSFDFPCWFRLPGRIMYGFFKPRNKVPGNELSGVIESIGEEVRSYQVSDKIIALPWGTSFQGATAEYKCLPENTMMVKKPDNISFEEAAAIPVGGITALHFIRKANINKGQRILILGASGSVGTYAVQLAKLAGAEVTGVCSTANLELVRSLGADQIIDYKEEDFTRNGKTYDFIFDAVRKTSFNKCRNSLTAKGFYLTLDWPLVDALKVNLFSKKKLLFGIAENSTEDLQYLVDLVAEGQLKVVIDKCYPLNEIIEAHRYVEKGHKKGNVVIRIT